MKIIKDYSCFQEPYTKRRDDTKFILKQLRQNTDESADFRLRDTRYFDNYELASEWFNKFVRESNLGVKNSLNTTYIVRLSNENNEIINEFISDCRVFNRSPETTSWGLTEEARKLVNRMKKAGW